MAFSATIEFSGNWSGTDDDYDNHESSLSDDEMKPLVKSILLLSGMDNPPLLMPAIFKTLSAAMQDSDETIVVTKGIHQRNDKVHFNIKIKGLVPVYHVFVGPGDNVEVESSPAIAGWGISQSNVGKTIKRTLFEYKTTGLSIVTGGNVCLLWPAQFSQLSELEKPLGRKRSTSFSIGNSTIVQNYVPKSADFF